MPSRARADDAHRPIARNEVEAAFETLLSRFVEADRRVGQKERDEARLMYVAERCVKTVLDLLKLTADAELLRKWTVKGYEMGLAVIDTTKNCMTKEAYEGDKVPRHIVGLHEIWRKSSREFGGIE